MVLSWNADQYLMLHSRTLKSKNEAENQEKEKKKLNSEQK